MSEKKFSFKRLAGDIGGSAAQGAATGAAAGLLVPDPTGTSLGVLVATGAAVGSVGGAVGSIWGVVTDDPYDEPNIGSAALYSSVVGLSISTILLFAVVLFGHGYIEINKGLVVIVSLSSVLSTASGFLIEDINAKKERRKNLHKL